MRERLARCRSFSAGGKDPEINRAPIKRKFFSLHLVRSANIDTLIIKETYMFEIPISMSNLNASKGLEEMRETRNIEIVTFDELIERAFHIVFTEKLPIFWNEGQLPENWTIENLLIKHPSKPFNPDIANALFHSGYIESWGRGTLKIIKECEQAGLPKPVYFYDMSGFFVEFRKDIYNEKYLKGLKLNERQLAALLHFKSKRQIVTSEYMKRYEITDRTARRDLTELVDKGVLNREGEKKASRYTYK